MTTAGLRFAALLFSLAGCTTVERGTSQVLSIQPDPPDAACTVRQGSSGTPMIPVEGKVEVPRSRLDLQVRCSKPGYQPAEVQKTAMYTEKAFSRISPLSGLVDLSSGANYSYPPTIRLRLVADRASASGSDNQERQGGL